jgi:UDP-N-acetylglucosamine acyltransferase
VESHIIIANNAALAGHVHVDDHTILGGFTAVHQFCRIGAHVMCGAGTVVLQDIPAYTLATGNAAKPHGINAEGLRRRGFSAESIRALKNAYKTVYRQNLSLSDAIDKLAVEAASEPALDALLRSLRNSTRGIIR